MAAESGRLQAGQGQGKRGKGRQTAISASVGVHNSNLPSPPMSLCVHWPCISPMGSVSLYGELLVCPLVCPLGFTCVHSSLTLSLLDPLSYLPFASSPLSPSLNVGHEHAVWCGTRIVGSCIVNLTCQLQDMTRSLNHLNQFAFLLGLEVWHGINVITHGSSVCVCVYI